MEELEKLEKEYELAQLKINAAISQSEAVLLLNNEYLKLMKMRPKIIELRKEKEDASKKEEKKES